MATIPNPKVISDLSSKDGAETIQFGFDGIWYEIDLTGDEHEKMAKALKPYIDNGRLTTIGRRPPRNLDIPDIDAVKRNEIREWAKENGFDINPRGMVPKHIVQAYADANPEDKISWKKAV